MEIEAVIGLEVHAQLLTKTKIFCGCSTSFGDAPNTHACPVCMGLPGALPVLNRKAVEMAALTGAALNCTIARKSIFARKNYFYPDLPKGYQISQYEIPLCSKGYLTVHADGCDRRIGIIRIHLEEDAGKLIHDQDVDSLFDVNRCGTPLIEIVSEPDMRSPAEAYSYLSELKKILRYLGICDCNMEEGSLRCDANISLRAKGTKQLGTKTELKNMNSFRGVEKALEHEILRQSDILNSGGHVLQETFLWDTQKKCTVAMRAKESAHDYRYFPEPDLMPLILQQDWIKRISRRLPELPLVRRQRFVSQYGLSGDHADVLTESRDIADYFEKAVENGAGAKTAANWIMGEILRMCKEKKKNVNELAVTPHRLAEILLMVQNGTISATSGKAVLNEIQKSGGEPNEVVEKLALRQISDNETLQKVVDEIVRENPEEFGRLKDGEKKLMSYFIGKAMKKTKGKGNPKEINQIISKLV